jgi:hypothetical protein
VFTVYDNMLVSGSQVLNAIRKFADQDQFGIQIVTGKNPAGQWYGKVINTGAPVDSVTYGSVIGPAPGTIADAMDEADINYVKPSGKFRAQLAAVHSRRYKLAVGDTFYVVVKNTNRTNETILHDFLNNASRTHVKIFIPYGGMVRNEDG